MTMTAEEHREKSREEARRNPQYYFDGYPEMLIDGDTAIVSRRDFDRLPEYSTSNPTGVYVGKVWKRVRPEAGVCQLGSYEENDPPNEYVLTNFRTLIVVDDG